LILAELAEKELHYEAVAVAPGFDGEFPNGLLGFDVRVSFSDVILARVDLKTADLKLSNIQTGNYSTNLVIPSPVLGPVTLPKQWAAVDAKIRGKSFRFISTHLEAFSPPVRVAQAGEIVAGPANTGLPTILLGDINASPEVPGDAAATLIAAGFVDVWSVAHPDQPGFTCCQAPDLLNLDSQLSQRIDLILARGGFEVIGMEIVGDDPADRTPSGRWPSDHAGVVATVQIPQ
jgi:endonuclease/exonuclease/phosphatase family metal-dependent hydrolase